MKSLAAIILLISLATPLLADDAVTSPSSKDLKALNQSIEGQKITKASSTPPVVNISGYADTSYTRALTGSGTSAGGVNGQTATKSGASLTTEKVSVNATVADKNGWFAGVQVDVIHCSSK